MYIAISAEPRASPTSILPAVFSAVVMLIAFMTALSAHLRLTHVTTFSAPSWDATRTLAATLARLRVARGRRPRRRLATRDDVQLVVACPATCRADRSA